MKKSLLSLVLAFVMLSAQSLTFSVLAEPAADENFEGYSLGGNITTINDWDIAGTEYAGDSAVIAADPDDMTNQVLKITTTTTSKVNDAPVYRLAVTDEPGNQAVKVSYKVKLDVDSHRQFGWGAFHLGTLRVENSANRVSYDQFAKWTFWNAADLISFNFTSHSADEGANWDSQRQIPVFDAVGGGWITITEWVDFNTGTFRAEAVKNGITVEIPTSYGSDKNAVYDKITHLQFAVKGSEMFTDDWVTDPGHPGVLYVDDVVIERESPQLTASITPVSSGQTPKFKLTTSNPISPGSLSGKLSALRNGVPVTGSDITVTQLDSNNYTLTVYGLEADTAYTIQLAGGLTDVFGQTIANDILLNFQTGTDEDNYLLKHITFSEPVYTLGDTVIGKDGWGMHWGGGDDGSAAVISEPGNPSNRILKIETVPDAEYGDFTVKLDLPDVSSQENIAKISYKIKVASESAQLAQWNNNFGTAKVNNSGTDENTDNFAKWNIMGGPNVSNQSYGIFGDTGWSNQINTDTLNPMGTWLQIDEYFDFSDGTVKAAVTDLTNYNEVKIGYVNTLYACDKEALYDTIECLLFQVKPNGSAMDNAVLYVDDIKLYRISTEPVYRVMKVSANYNSANQRIITEFYVFAEPARDVRFALAAYDKDTRRLVSVTTDTYYAGEIEDGYYDVYANLNNVTSGNVDVYAYLFDGLDTLKPLTGKYTVTLN
jgi:hypothetical protein